MKKILSIIIPSYNMERFLPVCLGSLLNDGAVAKKLEVLVVNDGSKDGTLAIARKCEEMWPDSITVVDKPNGNYGSCINVALPKVTGDFVKILDADDSFKTESLAAYVNFLERSTADLVVSDFEFIHEDGIAYAQQHYSLPAHQFSVADLPKAFCREVQMQGVAYRTEKLRTLDYHQTEGISYTDQEWMFAPMSTVETVEYFPSVVYRYLMGREGQTTNHAARIRGRWMILKITQGLARLFHEQGLGSKDSPAISYLQTRLLAQLHIVYSLCLLDPQSYEKPEDVADLDLYLCENLPEIYARMETDVPDNSFRFQYIRVWRQRGRKVGGLIFCGYHLACRIKRMARRMRHIKR